MNVVGFWRVLASVAAFLDAHGLDQKYWSIFGFLESLCLVALYASLVGIAQSLWAVDACLVIRLTRAPGGKTGLMYGKTSLSPLVCFLGKFRILLNFIGGCLLWHFWLGRAKHPGPGSVGIVVPLCWWLVD